MVENECVNGPRRKATPHIHGKPEHSLYTVSLFLPLLSCAQAFWKGRPPIAVGDMCQRARDMMTLHGFEINVDVNATTPVWHVDADADAVKRLEDAEAATVKELYPHASQLDPRTQEAGVRHPLQTLVAGPGDTSKPKTQASRTDTQEVRAASVAAQHKLIASESNRLEDEARAPPPPFANTQESEVVKQPAPKVSTTKAKAAPKKAPKPRAPAQPKKTKVAKGKATPAPTDDLVIPETPERPPPTSSINVGADTCVPKMDEQAEAHVVDGVTFYERSSASVRKAIDGVLTQAGEDWRASEVRAFLRHLRGHPPPPPSMLVLTRVRRPTDGGGACSRVPMLRFYPARRRAHKRYVLADWCD